MGFKHVLLDPSLPSKVVLQNEAFLKPCYGSLMLHVVMPMSICGKDCCSFDLLWVSLANVYQYVGVCVYSFSFCF